MANGLAALQKKLPELCMFVGAAAVSVGCGLISLAYGCMAAGGFLIAGGVLSVWGSTNDNKEAS